MPKFTMSVDDACASDVRLADLASRYEVPTVFYWPVEWHSLAYDHGYEPLDYVQALDIANRFEIGSHTITHRHLTKIGMNDAMKEIIGSQYMLRKMFRQSVTKFCPPRGYTNEDLTNLTLQFYQSQRLTKGKGLVHVHPESGANKNKPWRECINDDTKELWMHSWELDKFNLWDELEGVLRDYANTPSQL